MTPVSPFDRRPADLHEAEAQIAAIRSLLATVGVMHRNPPPPPTLSLIHI